MLAKKDLTPEEYTAWAEEYHAARWDCYKGSYCSAVCASGPLAQSVERRADNAKVESSRLSWTTFFFSLLSFFSSSLFVFSSISPFFLFDFFFFLFLFFIFLSLSL